MPVLFRSLIIILLLSGACASKSKSELSKALEAAVKDDKLSTKKMESIINEYNSLREEDKKKAGEYVVKVLNIIKMGGDSSHIDVVRRQLLGTKKKV